MQVLMVPHLSQLKGESGIHWVVEAYFRYLPEFGVELVEPDAESYDLLAAHAGCTGAECDVCHCHGLYWTADYDASDAEYQTNAAVVEAVRHARAVTVPSPWVAEVFQRDMRFTPYIIPHGIEWADWQHDEDNEGYILWNKNRTADVCDPEPLITLAKQFPDRHFVTTFASGKMPSNVVVVGLQSHAEMRKLVQRAGVYLATAKETFGIGILEAMAAGVPILGFDQGGVSDLVRHKTDGYLAHDPDDLAEGLHYCLANRKRLAASAQDRAKSYTWPNACKRVAEVYQATLVDEPATVSIIIPSYNYAALVGRAVRSAMVQTYSRLTNIVVVDDGSRDGSRAFDPTLWIDPKGRLWYIFNRGNKEKAVHDVHARICKDPDAEVLRWSEAFRVGYDAPYAFRLNKVTVLSTGEWLMPVTYAKEKVHAWFGGDKQLQGVGLSTDEGKTWKLYGAVQAPPWALECMVTELKDGRLWMLMRTGSGFLWESFSKDRGRTWSGGEASIIANPGSRFFIRRLASGNLLLVNHYKYDQKVRAGRSRLTARLSTDEGKTWNEGLLLDERAGVSYPDGVQDESGLIWIVYDRDRYGAGEILLARFTEEDVKAGKDVSGRVSLKQVIDRLEKPE